jgi:hypothetical protein
MGSVCLRFVPWQGTWRSTLLACVLWVGLLVAAPSAGAALGVSGGVLTYGARAGDANDIAIAFDGTSYTVTDVVPIDAAADASCLIAGNGATCPAAGVGSIRVNAADGNDRIAIAPSVTVPTELFGRAGDDFLSGGSGGDRLDGFTGDDTLIGNAGTDTADYASAPAGVSVNILLGDGIATGMGTDRFDPGQQLKTVENFRGSPGDDTINTRNGGIVNRVVCGGGQDLVLSDRADSVGVDCEDNNDAVAPAVAITVPGEFTSDPRPAVQFTVADKDPYTLDCFLDGQTVSGCAPGFQPAADLLDGPHSVSVRATDKYGNSEGRSVDFTVDTVVPETTLDSVPPEVTDTSTPSFSFSSDTSTFLCRFDDGDFFECTSPLVPSPPLANGAHTFEVAAIDAAGNVDQTPERYAFTVNAPIPAPPASGTTTQAGTSSVIIGSLVLISGRSVKLVKGRLVPITLTCAGQRRCDGRVTLTVKKPGKKLKNGKRRKARSVRLGSAKFSIAGNQKARVQVRLTKAKVKLLKRLRRVKARATIHEVDARGRPRVSTRTFMLRAR